MLYKQIYEELLAKINSGEYKSGDRLPTEYELMQIHNVSRSTAIKAVKGLETANLITRSRKNGTFVSAKPIDNDKQHIIPLILPYDDNFNNEILEGAHDYALSHNCYITFFNSCNSNKKEREILNKILLINPCGLIIYPCSFYSNLDVLSQFSLKNIPITFLDRAVPGIKAPLVTSDNKKGSYELINEIIRLGHKKIAYYSVHDNMLDTEKQRFEGYCAALIDNGIPINYDYIFRFNEDVRHKHVITAQQKKLDVVGEYCRRALAEYCNMKDKPDIICCINDETALVMIEECNALGIRVPQDLSISGFDLIENSRRCPVTLTTVKQNFFELGKLAVKSLHQQLNGYIMNFTIPTELFLGDSVTNMTEYNIETKAK